MKAPAPVPRPPRAAGATLVEVLLAVAILAILAVGGTAYFYHSRAIIEQTRNRRVALEAAVGRIEALRQALYPSIAPETLDYTPRYLLPAGTTWQVLTADPGETVLVNGRAMPITTTVRYLDVEDAQSDSYDYLYARVEVGYRVSGDERVVLETRISP